VHLAEGEDRSGMTKHTTQLEFLTRNDWMLIADNASEATFEAGQELIREACPIDNVYVIRKGSVRVEVAGKAIAQLGVGAICGEMGFLEGRPASASVVASSEVQADRIPAAKLREIFETFPTVGHRFFKSIALNLSRRLRDTSAALADKNRQNGNGHKP
jgi:CRP-like cAMP-binding protein